MSRGALREGAAESVVLGYGSHIIELAGVLNVNVEHNWATANVAILDVVRISGRTVDTGVE